MKKLISAILAISLFGATAASAQSYRSTGSYGEPYRHSSHNDGALIGLGIGLFALAAIAASQHHDRNAYDWRDRDDYARSYRDRSYPSYGQSYGYDHSFRDQGRYGYGGYSR